MLALLKALTIAVATLNLCQQALAAAAVEQDAAQELEDELFEVTAGERQLFLTEYGIASMRGLQRTMHKVALDEASGFIIPHPVLITIETADDAGQ